MCNMRSIFLGSVYRSICFGTVYIVSLNMVVSYAVVALSSNTGLFQPQSAVTRHMVHHRYKADRLMRAKDAARWRLPLAKHDIEAQPPARATQQASILDGCDRAVSPLSGPAAVSNPRRWLADNTTMETPKPMA